MNLRRPYLVGLALVAASLVASAFAYPEMPAEMATHWNAAGEADGQTPRFAALVGLPALSALLLGLFAVAPKFDPLGENVAAFRDQYDTFVVLAVGLLAYVHLLVIAWNAGYRFELMRVLSPALGALFYYSGVLLEVAERNWFVGIRTPWTLSDDEVWRRTHERAAPLFKVAGVVAALGALVPDYAIYVVAGSAAVVSLYTTVYSYVEYRRVAA